MSVRIPLPSCFELSQILDCGQAFRWRETKRNGGTVVWEGAPGNKALRVSQGPEGLCFFCSPEDFEDFWKDYFDLDTDYEAIRKNLGALDPVLDRASEFSCGIRILRQDPWEALCSFLISQNNNIPRIRGIIERLCQLAGEAIPETDLRSFPGPEVLAGMTVGDLAPIGAGYRAKYLIDAGKQAASGQVDLEKISRSPAETGRAELRKILGVGPKVAECALLYGFHKMECYPMDVWMKRVMTELLPGRDPAAFGEYAGLAQQYLFHYIRRSTSACKSRGSVRLGEPRLRKRLADRRG